MGVLQTLQSNRFAPIAPQSLQRAFYPLIAGRLPIPLSQILLQMLALASASNFHSCIIFKPVPHSETRPPSCAFMRRANSVISLALSDVEGTGVTSLLFRFGNTMERPGNRAELSRCDPPNRGIPRHSSIHFSYPLHSFFLLWKFLFPFDAVFPLALPLQG